MLVPSYTTMFDLVFRFLRAIGVMNLSSWENAREGLTMIARPLAAAASFLFSFK